MKFIASDGQNHIGLYDNVFKSKSNHWIKIISITNQIKNTRNNSKTKLHFM